MAARWKSGQVLGGMLDAALKVGETPYQANRRAVKQIDQMHDYDRGLKELDLMLVGLDTFIKKLEGFENAAAGLAQKAKSIR